MTQEQDEKLQEAATIGSRATEFVTVFIQEVTDLADAVFGGEPSTGAKPVAKAGTIGSTVIGSSGLLIIDDPAEQRTEALNIGKATVAAGAADITIALGIAAADGPIIVGDAIAVSYIGLSVAMAAANSDSNTITVSRDAGDKTIVEFVNVDTGESTLAIAIDKANPNNIKIVYSEVFGFSKDFDAQGNLETMSFRVGDGVLTFDAQTGLITAIPSAGESPIFGNLNDIQNLSPEMLDFLEQFNGNLKQILQDALGPDVNIDDLLPTTNDEKQEALDIINSPDIKAPITDLTPPIPERKPPHAQGSENTFEQGTNEASPLTLDLDMDGQIEPTAFSPDNISFFDLDNDGLAEQTGWTTGDDGFLALDRNGNFQIDNASELFGSPTVDGFTILSTLDSNRDGVISADDAEFSNLLIWRDDGDGISQASELFTLADFDIVSINLRATDSNQKIEGHNVPLVSTYTVDDGVSGPQSYQIVDVFFNYDDVNTRYTADFNGDLRTIFLPELRGYGDLPNLRVAMSLDNDIDDPVSLLAQVKELTFKSSLDQLLTDDGTIESAVQDIMYRWAGVDGVDLDSRSSNNGRDDFDARKIEFLEEYLGRDFLQHGSPDPRPVASGDIEAAFEEAFSNIYARILVQNNLVQSGLVHLCRKALNQNGKKVDLVRLNLRSAYPCASGVAATCYNLNKNPESFSSFVIFDRGGVGFSAHEKSALRALDKTTIAKTAANGNFDMMFLQGQKAA